MAHAWISDVLEDLAVYAATYELAGLASALDHAQKNLQVDLDKANGLKELREVLCADRKPTVTLRVVK